MTMVRQRQEKQERSRKEKSLGQANGKKNQQDTLTNACHAIEVTLLIRTIDHMADQ